MKKLLVEIKNILDFRYWFCDCQHTEEYGWVHSADCSKHSNKKRIRR